MHLGSGTHVSSSKVHCQKLSIRLPCVRNAHYLTALLQKED